MRRPLRCTIAVAVALSVLAGACSADERNTGSGAGLDPASPAASGERGDGAEPAGTASLVGADITVASKDYDEQLVLGAISKLALQAAGADVTDRIGLGDTEAVRAALTGGEIDHYWEYTGVGWLVHLDRPAAITDDEEQWRRVKAADRANGVVWTDPAPFNNTYGIAFVEEAAGDLGDPRTLSDLGAVVDERPDRATLCVEREFGSRIDGLQGMEDAYGYEFPDDHVTTLDAGVVYSAAASRDPCNFSEVFTTDGRIAALGLRVLEDDRGYFPVYNAAPVFTEDVYREYGQALDALFDPIARALTQQAVTEMNKRVSSDGQSPEVVAQSFLVDNGLLPE